jgi:large subunit ribosomal protein L29
MKKILGFSLITIIIIFTMTISVFAASNDGFITRASAVQKIVRSLYTTDKTKDFAFEENYCVHENGYAHFVPIDAAKGYPILCELYNSVDGSGFTDVSGMNDDAIFITLAKAMGIINGNGDNTFAPDDFLTYDQAVKMIVCIIGYGEQYAEEKGGYPAGYIAVADDFGITKGMSFQGDGKISNEDFELMLNNCLVMKMSPVNVSMIDFVPAASPELCVEAYAQAVKNRYGTIQYALMDDELRAKEAELRDQLFKLRFQKSVGQLENPLKLKNVRKDIARIQTLLNRPGKGTE